MKIEVTVFDPKDMTSIKESVEDVLNDSDLRPDEKEGYRRG